MEKIKTCTYKNKAVIYDKKTVVYDKKLSSVSLDISNKMCYYNKRYVEGGGVCDFASCGA